MKESFASKEKIQGSPKKICTKCHNLLRYTVDEDEVKYKRSYDQNWQPEFETCLLSTMAVPWRLGCRTGATWLGVRGQVATRSWTRAQHLTACLCWLQPSGVTMFNNQNIGAWQKGRRTKKSKHGEGTTKTKQAERNLPCDGNTQHDNISSKRGLQMTDKSNSITWITLNKI